MNIYFTGAVRGGRAHQPDYARIVSELEKYGVVFSKHVAGDTLSEYGETSLTGQEILERERMAIEKSDVMVAEVTTPSLGVGYLISYAVSLGKKVIALYQASDTTKLSEMVKGDVRIAVHLYKTGEDIADIFENDLSN